MKILFCYTELAAYTLACLNELAASGAEVLVIHYPVNREAPFVFQKNQKIRFIEISKSGNADVIATAEQFGPQIIFCSGWSDPSYLEAGSYFKKKNIPVVLCMDNSWKFSFRKIAGLIASRLLILPKFSGVWVPGQRQVAYARKLGFRKHKIFTGFYCADTDFWNRCYIEFREEKRANYPRVFFYAGRYYDFKGLAELWAAFAEFKKGKGRDWELWCAGTGDLQPVKSEGIVHLGFIQPAEMKQFIRKTGVFVFPSRFEPWGVAVHEFAAAGFPLLLSSEIGAKESFLIEGENGFSFCAGDRNSLLRQMNRFADLSENELNAMSDKSNAAGLRHTLHDWVQTVREIKEKLVL